MSVLRRMAALLALAAMIASLAGQAVASDMGTHWGADWGARHGAAMTTVTAVEAMAATGGCGACDNAIPDAAACFVHCTIAVAVLPTVGAVQPTDAARPRPFSGLVRAGRSIIPDPHPPRSPGPG